jgi:hypothetical protein
MKKKLFEYQHLLLLRDILGLYYKTLRLSKLQKMDKFCSKLVSSSLEKTHHLSKQTHLPTTESIH